MDFQELGAKSPDGKAQLAIVPYVQPNGQPGVMMLVKKNVPGVFETTLDGEPAFGIRFSEEAPGVNNAPWEIGHLMADNWDKAKRLAGK